MGGLLRSQRDLSGGCYGRKGVCAHGSPSMGCAGAELWVTKHEARLRDDVAKIVGWREAIRGNRLAKGHLKPPFPGMEGE